MKYLLFMLFIMLVSCNEAYIELDKIIRGPNPCHTDGIPNNCPGGFDAEGN